MGDNSHGGNGENSIGDVGGGQQQQQQQRRW
jgi:hypothetical protein